MKITSLNNEKVLYWNKLKMKKERDIEGLFTIESDNLVKEALALGIVKEIITTDEEEYDIPTYQVSKDVMTKISNLKSPSNIMAICKYMVPKKIDGNVLVLDDIQDPGNLGTIIRSAVAFNFKTIICSNNTVDMYNDKVIRSSEGMLFKINIIKTDLKDIIPKLKNDGYKIIGTDVNNGTDVRKIKKEKLAIVIGNEGHGVSNEINELCDDFIYLKTSDNCESLNAAVASSIIMYEVNYE